MWLRPLTADTAAQVRDLMVGVVRDGTGTAAAIPGVAVAGKTGTAEVDSGDPHAWFIGFAPAEAPRVAVAVIVEHGGTGGAVAAPIAHDVHGRGARQVRAPDGFGSIRPAEGDGRRPAGPRDESEGPVIGQVFDDRYEIKRKLGAGGMAEVYLAHDRHLDRDVALKVLHSNYAQDEQFIERFRREASNAASLNHPNIVQIYDRGEAEGTYYIAMEYLDGRPLKDIIVKYAPLRAEHVVSIASQILEALRFAHRKDIIHRDIKPQNIIVDDEGRVKVTDFGIARAGGAARMTETGSILGTAHYFSPEQATGGRVEAASDLYSLGVVMYEMVTAHLPFTGENAVAIAMQHVNDAPPPAGPLVPGGVPENLEHVIMRALVKDPALRYLTADAFLDDLRKVQGGQSVPPPPSLADEATRVLAPAAAVAAASDRTTVRPAGPKPGAVGGAPAVTPAPPIKRSSVWPWVLVLLFVLALGVGLYLLLSSMDGSTGTQVDVPDLIGKTQQEAQLVVDDLGIKLSVEGTKPSQDVDKVVEQSPVERDQTGQGRHGQGLAGRLRRQGRRARSERQDPDAGPSGVGPSQADARSTHQRALGQAQGHHHTAEPRCRGPRRRGHDGHGVGERGAGGGQGRRAQSRGQHAGRGPRASSSS